ncbi:hypothetical protein PWT90_03029 [Aphanocladium album]|nr:hypothetical protein PWT90_03029 [Aphanocladium album]
MTSVAEVPLEILEQIVQDSKRLRDVSALLRTCRAFYQYNAHFLYTHNKKRKRALAYAIEHNYEHLFNRMLEWPKARVTLENVLQACQYGRLAMLERMLACPGVKAQLEPFSDKNEFVKGYSPLQLASRHGHADVVEYLLAMPATGINLRSGPAGLSALHAALTRDCEDNQAIPLLLKAGANPLERKRGRGNTDTPLEFAIRSCNASGLRLLLEGGPTPEGETMQRALLEAIVARDNACDMSKYLLEHGASASAEAPSTPVKQSQEDDCESLETVYDVCGSLAGCYANPLGRAILRSKNDVVELLLRHGADPRELQRSGTWCALAAVLYKCRLETCKIFASHEHGIPVDIEARRSELLEAAALSGNVEILRWALDNPVFQVPEENAVQYSRRVSNLLRWTRSPEVAELLLQRGADPNIEDGIRSPFEIIMAIRTMDKKVQAAILTLLAVRGTDLSRRKLVYEKEFLEMTDSFISRRTHIAPVLARAANIDIPMSKKNELLHACVGGKSRGRISLVFMKFLVNWGVDINTLHPETAEPVIVEVLRMGHYRHLNTMLELKANIHFVARGGNTLLHFIRFDRGGAEVRAASKLIELGVDPNAVNSHGHTPIDVAVGSSCSAELLELLVLSGTDITKIRPLGRNQDVQASSVHLAVIGVWRSLGLETFIRLGVDVNVRDAKQRTPLHWANSYDRKEAARLLIAAGADVHAQDANGHLAGKVTRRLYPDLQQDVAETVYI